MSTALVPCKRPRVQVVDTWTEASLGTSHLAHRVICDVPTCGWTYGPAVKTDAQQQAARHRGQHRVEVPRTLIKRDVEWDVYCTPCGGHRRTFDTKPRAQAWLDEHLASEHGVVTCS